MTERVRPPISAEPVSFTPDLVGLQTRLLLGNTALNPSQNIDEHLDPASISSFERRSYRVFEVASKSERTEYWNATGIDSVDDQVAVWSRSMSSLISTKDFSESEREFYASIGIETDSFSAEDAADFYFNNFANNPNKLKKFVEASIRAHLNEATASIDYNGLMNNMNTITWFANIFGPQSSELVAQLIDAEIKLITEPEIFTQDPSRLNNLTAKEEELLGFAWQHHIEEPTIIHPEADNEDEQREPLHERIDPYNVADRLVDYESGSVTGEQVDLLPYYSGFVENVRSKFESGHPLFQCNDSKLILSDVAVAMIDRVASRSNEVDKELGFTIQGNNIGGEGELIFTGAYIVPVLDFTTAQQTTMAPNFSLNERLKKTLGRNTNLSDYFLQTTGRKTGDRIGTLHIHQSPLGESYRAQPSTGDIRYVERILRETGRQFYIWGVVTKSRGQLDMRVVVSKRDQLGAITHNEIPVFYEAVLREEMPIAA